MLRSYSRDSDVIGLEWSLATKSFKVFTSVSNSTQGQASEPQENIILLNRREGNMNKDMLLLPLSLAISAPAIWLK